MITTSLGTQYLHSALAKSRQSNAWANHIAWERMPQRYRDEIELAARLMMTVGTSTVEEIADFIPETATDDVAA